MIPFPEKEHYTYADLLHIIALLRSPEGCPWDKVQTHKSIRRGLLEEAYEAAEGIDRDDPKLLCEELGDLLMQVVFHADIEKDAGRFTMDDVCDGVVKKLLFRHPHVFGTAHEDSGKRPRQLGRLEADRKRPLPAALTGRISTAPWTSSGRRWASWMKRYGITPISPRNLVTFSSPRSRWRVLPVSIRKPLFPAPTKNLSAATGRWSRKFLFRI